MDDLKRRLIWDGIFLFLLGLITGFLEPHFNNMRMGLAAHLEGVMNGTGALSPITAAVRVAQPWRRAW